MYIGIPVFTIYIYVNDITLLKRYINVLLHLKQDRNFLYIFYVLIRTHENIRENSFDFGSTERRREFQEFVHD